MAIYNKRAEFSQEQFEVHFQKRNSILNTIYSIIRFLVIIVENLYCIPSYLVLSWLILLPTSWFKSELYLKLENYLYNSLLFIVSSWSLAAGLTVVESGDEFKHLIEEPEKHYPDKDTAWSSDSDANKSLVKDKLVNSDHCFKSPKKFLDANNRFVDGYVAKVNGTSLMQVRDHNAKTNGKINKYKGDEPVTKETGIKNNGCHARQENVRKSTITAENEILKSNNNNISERVTTIARTNIRYGNGISPNRTITREAALEAKTFPDVKLGALKSNLDKPKILLLCNHISTADVPLIMQSFSTLTNQSILWVLDAQFKLTNFGVVCSSHGDFFVAKNSYVDGSLREHVLKYPDRNLFVLFPEGGFLRKRIEGSNRYATRNGLPHTKYVTHPRFGAFKDLIDPSVGITHIVDATLIYNDVNNPISILDIAFGNKKEPAILHFKVYKRSEINPTEEWLRNIWLEKERFLTKYYEDKTVILKQLASSFRVAALDWFKVLSVHLYYLLVCYLSIFRLLNATSVTMLKARELYYSNI